MRRIHFLAGLVGAAMLAGTAATAQDHPDLGRFQGSEQVGHQVSEYDETLMIVGPVSQRASDVGGQGWRRLEGKLYHLYYKLPEGRTALEAQRNYEASLKTKGYEIVFTCATNAGNCFLGGAAGPGLFLGSLLDRPTDMPRLQLGDHVRNKFMDGAARYTYARKASGEAEVHIALAFSDDARRGRYVIAKVVESAAMKTDQIDFTKAEAIKTQLDAAGRIDIYGIQFDTDSAVIKPESAAQLGEIAKLLRENPGMALDVVGHTDDQGTPAHNLDLSKRRSDAVVAALARDYGIPASRLTGIGRGLQDPVASNSDESGRAKNRRVELKIR